MVLPQSAYRAELLKKMNDLVSIIMPSYNTEEYISDSIQSVIDQTYRNWELIIVDDCSTDRTEEKILQFRDERIKYFKNEKNSGAAISRNRALREAKGKWIAFLDSDDLWVPEKLEKQIRFMEEHQYHMSYTDYRICFNGVWENVKRTAPNKMTLKRLYNYCYFSTITVMYDREVVGLVQIADLKKNNDYAMWFQVLSKTHGYRFPECLSFYIKHSNSVSSGNKIKLIKYHYLLFRKGLGKSKWNSSVLTFNNLMHGVIKKFKYKEKLTESVSKNESL